MVTEIKTLPKGRGWVRFKTSVTAFEGFLSTLGFGFACLTCERFGDGTLWFLCCPSNNRKTKGSKCTFKQGLPLTWERTWLMTEHLAAKSTRALNFEFHRERTLCVLIFNSGVSGALTRLSSFTLAVVFQADLKYKIFYYAKKVLV